MELTRTLTLLLLLTLSASAQTPRFPSLDALNKNGLKGFWLAPGAQKGNGLVPAGLLDLSRFGGVGATVNGPTYSANGMKFSGTQYVNITNSVLKTPQFTIALWVRPTSIGTQQALFCNDGFNSSTYYGSRFDINTTGVISTSVGTGGVAGPTSRDSLTGSTALAAGKWYFVCVVRRGVKNMSLYINTVEDAGMYSGTGTTMGFSANLPGTIGSLSGGESPSTAEMLFVRYYDRPLHVAEIKLMHRGLQ